MIEEKKFVIRSSGVDETVYWGRMLGKRLAGGSVVALIGELGAGKTCFVQGVAEGLQVLEDQYVTSPTFTLINEYKGSINLYHFDLYRIQDEREIEGLGYEEYLFGNGAVLIEWAEKMKRLLPAELLMIEIKREDENTRQLIFTGKGKRYCTIVEEMDEHQKYRFYSGYRLLRKEV
jgi:tRNA threonylcarbamoyladenosine biosynthesis protein TsaE